MKNSLILRISTIVKKKAMLGSNIASQKWVRLQSKFVNKNIINLSRQNLSASKILLLYIGFEFVPTANKADCAKFKTE